MSPVEAVETVGKLGGLLPSFPSAVGTVENMQFVFHGFQLRGSFHSLGSRKALSARLAQKLGPDSASNEFFAPNEWYGLCGRGELSAPNRPGPTTPFGCANCVGQTLGHDRDEAADQAWR